MEKLYYSTKYRNVSRLKKAAYPIYFTGNIAEKKILPCTGVTYKKKQFIHPSFHDQKFVFELLMQLKIDLSTTPANP